LRNVGLVHDDKDGRGDFRKTRDKIPKVVKKSHKLLDLLSGIGDRLSRDSFPLSWVVADAFAGNQVAETAKCQKPEVALVGVEGEVVDGETVNDRLYEGDMVGAGSGADENVIKERVGFGNICEDAGHHPL
jgi:hypothetical protein